MDRIISGRKSRFRKFWLAGIMLTVLCAVVFAFSTFGTKRLSVSPERVTIQPVIDGKFIEYIPLNGTVLPIKTIYIDVVEGGRVEEIFIEDGKEISQGTSIIRLSNQQFQMDAINREAQLLDQQNNLRTSRLQMDQQTAALREQLNELNYNLADSQREFDMNTSLYADSVISRIEFEKSRDKLNYLKKGKRLLEQKIYNDSLFRINQLGRVESSLTLIDQNISFLDETVKSLVVKAPITGLLSQLQVELGQTVNAGARIGQIDLMNDLKVRCSVPEHYVTRVTPGLTATFTLGALSYKLTVHKVYPEITGGQFQIDLLFAGEKPENIRRGQTLQVKLALGQEGEAVQVPRGAFFQSTGGHWIYVINPDGIAERREIRIGRQNADYYEVLEGLQKDDRVITSGYDLFGDAEQLIIESK